MICALLCSITLITGCKTNIARDEHTFPRRCFVGYNIDQYAAVVEARTGDSNYMYQFDVIRTRTVVSDLLNFLEASPQEWVDNTLIYYTFCQKSVRMYNGTPPNWAYRFALTHPTSATKIAVYENARLGREWRLRDENGDKVIVYRGSDNELLNWHPNCPLGLWDGNFKLHGKSYNIGDTRGLTVSQWIPVMASKVMVGTDFEKVYCGYELDDDPCYGYMPWHIPRPRAKLDHDHNPSTPGIPWQAYELQCKETNAANFRAFPKALSRKLIPQAQYDERVGYNQTRQQEMTDIYYECFAGAKFTGYTRVGSGPYLDYAWWWDCLPLAETGYHVYGKDGSIPPMLDRIQGLDFSLVEASVDKNWDKKRTDRHLRQTLSACLTSGNAYYAIVYQEDEAGMKFLRGDPGYCDLPPTIPELFFELGVATSDPFDIYDKMHPDKPLHARYFKRGYANFTVVCNPYKIDLLGVPAEDGGWFKGLWPHVQKIVISN